MKEAVIHCNEVRELMPDLAAGLSALTPAVKQHLSVCCDCAGKLEAFRQTMSLLDEWRTPEPSPYFDVRLQARVRQEKAHQPSVLLQWLRKPALALSFAVLMVVSVTLVRINQGRRDPVVAPAPVQIAAEPGTPVGDLQALEKNHELYSDFDLLDDLQVQQDVNSNP
jgi:hypothetical protein